MIAGCVLWLIPRLEVLHKMASVVIRGACHGPEGSRSSLTSASSNYSEPAAHWPAKQKLLQRRAAWNARGGLHRCEGEWELVFPGIVVKLKWEEWELGGMGIGRHGNWEEWELVLLGGLGICISIGRSGNLYYWEE